MLPRLDVHPTAIVEAGAELGEGVQVGAYSYVRSGARVGARTKIHSHVNIWGNTQIDEDNEIYPYCALGAPPQIIGEDGATGRLKIGKKNVLREGVEIHCGSKRAAGETRVGDENYIMTSVHIGHDCQIGNKTIIASKSGLSGHVEIHDFAVVSGAVGISQFVRVGSYSFCAGMTRMEKDLPPYLCAKEFSEVTGPNLVGLKRAGFNEKDIRVVKEIYKSLYVGTALLTEQMSDLEKRFSGHPVFERFLAFTKASTRGIMRNS